MLTGKSLRRENSSFVQALSEDALEYFTELSKRTFKEQTIAVLNAYWDEIGSQAPIVYEAFYKKIIATDMMAQNVDLLHLYNEGSELELNMALHYYQKLYDFVKTSKEWNHEDYKISQPRMLTTITRRNELRDKVDVTISNKISMLEVLLDQYREHSEINPASFVKRAMASKIHPEVQRAMNELAEVQKKINVYEVHKKKIEDRTKLPGIKGTSAKHELAIFNEGPEKNELDKAMLKADAAVRIVSKKFGGSPAVNIKGNPIKGGSNQGSIFWVQRELEEKKRLYGNRKL